MRKKIKAMIAAALMLSLSGSLLAGCSSSGTKAGSSDGKVQLEVFSNKAENKNTLIGIIKDFEKENPNIKVIVNAPPESGTVLRSRLTKDDMPDVLSIGGDVLYADLAKANALKDLSSESMVQQIQPAYIDMENKLISKDEKKVYGIPFATNAGGVIYNKDKFEKLGLQVPKTWDEFIQTAEKIKAAGEIPFYLTLKDDWTGMCFWNPLAANIAPKDFIDKRLASETTFKKDYDEVATKALEILNYGHKDNLGTSYNDGNMAFAQGKGVMYLQGNWAISDIKKANPKINLGMFSFPATNNAADNKLVSGIDVLFAIPTKAKHPEEALKLVQFMNKKENAEKYIKEQFAFSALKDVFQNDDSVKDLLPIFQSGNITGFVDHYYPSSIQASRLVQAYFNKKDKSAFLSKLDLEWDKAVKK